MPRLEPSRTFTGQMAPGANTYVMVVPHKAVATAALTTKFHGVPSVFSNSAYSFLDGPIGEG